MGGIHSVWALCAFLSFTASVSNATASFRTKLTQMMDEAEYKNAIILISKRLTNPHVQANEKVILYWNQAICFISVNNRKQTKTAFLKLLALEPTFSPKDNTSPKVLAEFNLAKSHFAQSGGFNHLYQPKLTPVDDHHESQTMFIEFEVKKRLRDIRRVVFFSRKLGSSVYTEFDLAKDSSGPGRFIAQLPSKLFPSLKDSYAVEYYVEAYSPTNTKLVNVGSPQFPLSFLMQNKEQMSAPTKIIQEKKHTYWPYWLGVGTVVLAGTIFSIVYFTSNPNASIELNIHPGKGA